MVSKGEQTRSNILDRARQVFHRKGFNATSINDLLEATGATKGNLYFHFSGKEEIGLAVLRRERDRFMVFLDEALRGPTPGAGLDNFFRQALDMHRGMGFVGGCLFGNTALEASDTSSEHYAGLVREVFSAWVEKLAEAIEQAQQLGEVRTDLAALALAEAAVAALEGGIMQSRLFKSELHLKRTLETLRRLLELKVA